jgi:hypothetical protein
VHYAEPHPQAFVIGAATCRALLVADRANRRSPASRSAMRRRRPVRRAPIETAAAPGAASELNQSNPTPQRFQVRGGRRASPRARLAEQKYAWVRAGAKWRWSIDVYRQAFTLRRGQGRGHERAGDWAFVADQTGERLDPQPSCRFRRDCRYEGARARGRGSTPHRQCGAAARRPVPVRPRLFVLKPGSARRARAQGGGYGSCRERHSAWVDARDLSR